MGMNTDAVQRLYVAYFNRPADPASLAVYEAMLPTDREATQAELEALAEAYFSPSQEYQDLYSGMSNSQIINQMYQNLFGRDAEPAGLLHWTGKLIDGSETFASIALQLTYSAQGTDLDSINAKITAATAFTTEVASTSDNIIGFSGNAAAASARSWLATVTDDASATSAVAGVATAVANSVAASTDLGATYNLAVGQDALTGGAGGDTFDGTKNSNGGTVDTLTFVDNINGGDGTDTVLVNQGALADADFAALTSIENIVTNGNTVLGAEAQRAGIVDVNSSGAAASLTLTSGYTNDAVKFTAEVADTSVVDLQNATAGDVNRVTLDVDSVGDNTVAYATMQAEDSDGNVTGGISQFDDEGTVLRSTTAAITFDVRDSDGTEKATVSEVHLGTLAADTISAAAGVSVYAAGGAGADSLAGDSGSDYLEGGAGNDTIVTGTGNNGATGGAGTDTITGGSGNDTISGGAGNDSVTSGGGIDNISGGDGNDTIAMAATLASTDTISGGAGTDTLTVTADPGATTAADALFTNITGVETLTIAAGATTATVLGTAAQAAGLTTINQETAGATDDDLDISAFTSGVTVNIGTGNDSVSFGTGDDTLVAGTGELDTNDTMSFGAGTDQITISGTNTLDLDDITGLENIVTAATTGVDTVAITFDAVTTNTAAQTITVDASAMTGTSDNLTVTNNSALAATTFNITGSTGGDTLNGGAGADTIAGGAGADSLADGAGNDMVVGGSGNDTLAIAGGSDNVSGGAGNDTITITAANLSAADTINGGDGTDTLSATTALGATTAADAAFANVSSIETFTTSSGAVTLGANAQAAGVVTFNQNTGGTDADDLDISAYTTGATVNIGTGDDSVAFGSGNDVLVATNGELDTNDTMSFGAGTDQITISGSNTLDLDDITGLENIVTAATTGVDTVAITFDAVTTNTAAQTITVDASAMTGTSDNLTVTNSSNLAATTFNITGSTGADTLAGGAGGDTISGAAGNDNLSGGGGADTITDTEGSNTAAGGAGNDTITVGDLNDTVTTGAGNDYVTAGGGADSITSGGGNDTIMGGAGNDTMVFGANFDFDDSIDGGAGADTLSSDATTDINFLQVSNVETLTLGTGTSVIGARAQSSGISAVNLDTAGANNDSLDASAFTTGLTVNIGTGDDSISLGTGDDILVAGTGELDGSDTVAFGTGTDQITVSGSNTVDLDLVTGLENVVVANTTTTDTVGLTFAAVTDTTAQTITVDGSALTDAADNLTVTNSSANTASTFNITGTTGGDTLAGGTGADTIHGGAGDDSIAAGNGANTVTVTAGSNTVTSGTGNDTITGGTGGDSLNSGAGNDTLSGGAGADTLNAGAGLDRMTGGAGADTFVVSQAETSNYIYSTITDLALGTGGDTISGFDTGASTAAETFNTTAVTLGSNATFVDYLNEAAKTTGTEGELSWFQFGGNTYIVQDNSTSTTFQAGDDIVVEIIGEVDLSGMTVGDGELGP